MIHDDFEKVDTSAIYCYVENKSSIGIQFRYLRFSSNGEIIKFTKHDDNAMPSQSDFDLPESSVFKGRFSLMDNRLKLEYFNPGEPNPFTEKWIKRIAMGTVYSIDSIDSIGVVYSNSRELVNKRIADWR